MGFVIRFLFFAVLTILAVMWAPEKLRQPGAVNKAAICSWFLLAGVIFWPYAVLGG